MGMDALYLRVFLSQFLFITLYSNTATRLHHSYIHKIYVSEENGTDNASCFNNDDSTAPCKTFGMALEGIKKYTESTAIYIDSGNYSLGLNNFTTWRFVNNIGIFGSGQYDTIIKCDPLVGITVMYSGGCVTFEKVALEDCGQYVEEDSGATFQSALYITGCECVILSRMVVRSSNGTGILLIGARNSAGNVTIEHSAVLEGRTWVPEKSNYTKSFLIGGGIILFQSGGKSVISNSTISSNNFATRRSVVSCLYDGAGGITIIEPNSAHIDIQSCTIVKNTREIFVYGLTFSKIRINNSKLSKNSTGLVINHEGSFDSYVQLYNVSQLSDLIMISKAELNSTAVYKPNGYDLHYEQLCISMNFSSELSSFPISYKQDEPCSVSTRVRGMCSNIYEDYTGHCPVPYSNCENYPSINCYCDDNHVGVLCGKCAAGLSVAINSPYLSCVNCSSTLSVAKGWTALIGLQILPIAVLIAVIAIVNVNLNQGSLSSYILFCQLLTIPFPSVGYPSWIITKKRYFIDTHLMNIILLPFTMWNLDFISVYFQHHTSSEVFASRPLTVYYRPSGFSMCISQDTTALGSLLFWYVISFYPFMILIFLYICIHLYSKGYKVAICVLRPFHRLLARFWRLFGIQPSFAHTIASVYTLCFTQLAAISLKLLHSTQWHDNESGKSIKVFYYDGSQEYFKAWHIPAVLIAILVLLVLTLLTLYLLLCPFKWFQRLFGFFSFKKDLILSVTDVFMGPFKNGMQQNSLDYRYFAGVHFALRLVIMTFYYIPQKDQNLVIIPALETVVCALFVCVIVIFRPFRRDIHTFSEMFLFLILGLFGSCYFLGRYINSDFHWYEQLVIPVLIFILVIVVIPYCVIWIINKCRYAYQHLLPVIGRRSIQAEYQDNNGFMESDDEFLADRIANPERYTLSSKSIDVTNDDNTVVSSSYSTITTSLTFRKTSYNTF